MHGGQRTTDLLQIGSITRFYIRPGTSFWTSPNTHVSILWQITAWWTCLQIEPDREFVPLHQKALHLLKN